MLQPNVPENISSAERLLREVFNHDGPICKKITEADMSMLDNTLVTLNEREESVVRRYYGIGRECVSQKEICAEFGITEETLHEVVDKALRKLRHPTRSKHFRELFFNASV